MVEREDMGGPEQQTAPSQEARGLGGAAVGYEVEGPVDASHEAAQQSPEARDARGNEEMADASDVEGLVSNLNQQVQSLMPGKEAASVRYQEGDRVWGGDVFVARPDDSNAEVAAYMQNFGEPRVKGRPGELENVTQHFVVEKDEETGDLVGTVVTNSAYIARGREDETERTSRPATVGDIRRAAKLLTPES